MDVPSAGATSAPASAPAYEGDDLDLVARIEGLVVLIRAGEAPVQLDRDLFRFQLVGLDQRAQRLALGDVSVFTVYADCHGGL